MKTLFLHHVETRGNGLALSQVRGRERRRRWCASAHAKNARERKRETASSIALRGPLWPS
jgi:hypothetical protein